MTSCEMCGKEGGLSKVQVAGTKMNLCSSCSIHGKTEEKSNSGVSFYKRKREEILEKEVVSNAVQLIQKKLSVKDMNVHHLARAINIKESSLQKYMSGKIKIDLQAASKIEFFLEIKITEEAKTVSVDDYLQEEDEPLSLGDLIKKQLGKN